MTSPRADTQEPELVLEDRFAMVPEWVLDAEISDCAVRLYAVLLPLQLLHRRLVPGRAAVLGDI